MGVAVRERPGTETAIVMGVAVRVLVSAAGALRKRAGCARLAIQNRRLMRIGTAYLTRLVRRCDVRSRSITTL